MYTQLERMDTQFTMLEDMFDSAIKSKAVDIEHLDPAEMAEREIQMEFSELKRLEKQMKRVQKEKIHLLNKE